MADRGIYPKYVVFKHPREEAIGFMGTYLSQAHLPKEMGLVEDFTFVLKPETDPHARVALAAYAESVKAEKPQLSAEIYEVLSDF